MPIDIGGIMADLDLDSKKLERGVANARKAIEAIEAEIKQVQAEAAKGLIMPIDASARIAALNQTLGDLSAALPGAYSRMQNLGTGLGVVNAAMGVGASRSGQLGQALMQVGYIADDLQYGFQGIVNNIAPFVHSATAAMGASAAMSAGIASGVQVAAVAVYQLYVHWDQLTEAIIGSPVKTEAEQMEELGKQTKKTAEETAKLNRYKKEQHEINQMMEKRPAAEEDKKKAEEAVIVEADAAKIYKGVRETIETGGLGAQMTEDEKARLEKLHENIPLLGREKFEAKQKEVRDRINAANDELAREIVGRPENRAMLRDMAAQHPGRFPEGFGRKLGEARGKGEQKEADEEYDFYQDKLADQIAEMKRVREKNKKYRDIAEKLNRGEDTNDEVDKALEKEEEAKVKERIRQDAETKRETREIRQKRVKEAKDKAPGIEAIAERMTAQAVLLDQQGRAHEDPVMAIRRELEARGMDPEKAVTAGADLAKHARQSIGEKMARGLLEGHPGHAAQFSAADVASRVQAGVSNNPMKTTEDLLKEIKQNTEMMAKDRRKGVRPEWELIH